MSEFTVHGRLTIPTPDDEITGFVVAITPESAPKGISTVTLEQQGIPTAQRHAIQSVHQKIVHALHNRCQHEARSKRGVIRQCHNTSVTTRDGQRLCWRHAQ